MKHQRIGGSLASLMLCLTVLFTGCKKAIELDSFSPKDPSIVLVNDAISVGKEEQDSEFKMTSNLPWRTKSNADWITVDNTSLSGAGEKESTIKIKINRNPTIQPRTGTVSIWITEAYQKNFTVNQAAGDPPPIVKRNLYVKVGATGDGASWTSPISLSAALAMNLDEGDMIHIAAGTYQPEISVTGGSAIVAGDKTFEVKQNIKLIGGYPANATSGALADPMINATVLDGNSTANHVLTISAPSVTGQQVSISGITVQKGNTSTSTSSTTINGLAFPKTNGGGIIVGRAAVELVKCIITDNTGWSGGAGIYAFTNAKVTLRESVVKNNTVSSTGANGGGLHIEKQSDLYVYSSSISTNGAGGFAGALYQYTGSFHIYNSTINGNGAGFVGSTTTGKAYGGVYLREGTGELVNCTIHGNTSSNIGGGIGVFGTAAAPANLQIISSTVTGNMVKNASALGGGLYMNAADVTVNIHNSIISGNTRGATGTGTASDVEGVAAAGWTKKSSVIGSQVFDFNAVAISGATFDFATMLGSLANNGGGMSTVKLSATGNPAVTNGMTSSQLTTLGASLPTQVPASIISFDQIGNTRSGKTHMGSLVL